jgi:glycine/D-amino acid oxidase-like deaminating enzyme
MAQAIVVTLEKELPDAFAAYAKTGSGKALARESEKLDFAARCRGVPPLTSLLSESQAALAEKLKTEGFDPAKMRLPPEVWFNAGEGLKTVRALAEQVRAKLNDFRQPNPILRDLSAAETLLIAAEAAGVRFHFTKT